MNGDQTRVRFLEGIESSFTNWKAELLPLLTAQLKGKSTPLEVLLSPDNWIVLKNNPIILILLGKWFPELRKDKKLVQLFNKADQYFKNMPLVLYNLDPATYDIPWVKAEYDKLDSQGILIEELKKSKPKKIKHRTVNPTGILKPRGNLSQKQTYGIIYSSLKKLLDLPQKDMINLIACMAGYNPNEKVFKTIKSEIFTGRRELRKLNKNFINEITQNLYYAIWVKEFLKDKILIISDSYWHNLYMEQRILLFKSFTISYNELLAWIECGEFISDAIQNVVTNEKKGKFKEDIQNFMNNCSKTLLYKKSIRRQVLNNKYMVELFDNNVIEFNETKPKYSKTSLTPIKEIDFDHTEPGYFKNGKIGKLKFAQLYEGIKEQNNMNNLFDNPNLKNALSKSLTLPSYLKGKIKPYKGRKTLLNIGSTIFRHMNVHSK